MPHTLRAREGADQECGMSVVRAQQVGLMCADRSHSCRVSLGCSGASRNSSAAVATKMIFRKQIRIGWPSQVCTGCFPLAPPSCFVNSFQGGLFLCCYGKWGTLAASLPYHDIHPCLNIFYCFACCRCHRLVRVPGIGAERYSAPVYLCDWQSNASSSVLAGVPPMSVELQRRRRCQDGVRKNGRG